MDTQSAITGQAKPASEKLIEGVLTFCGLLSVGVTIGIVIVLFSETIADGSYKPLSRPIFIYVGKKASDRDEVNRFVEFYLNDGGPLAKEVGYIPLTAAATSEAKARYSSKTVGTVSGQ